MIAFRTELREAIRNRSERTWGSSLRRSLLTVLAGTVLSVVVYGVLLSISRSVPFLFRPNAASVLAYAVAILSVSISYADNRGVVPTHLLALQVAATAFYYDVQFHSDGILTAPVNLAVQKAVPVALLCWGIGVLLATLVKRSPTSR